MIKISFWFIKPNTGQANSEYITIDNPKKSLDSKLVNMYSCEVYLSDKKVRFYLTYGDNPIDALCFASEWIKIYLQGLVNHGYIISEVDSHKPWKLEKKDPMVNLQEKIEAIKNNKNISQEGKDKILGVLKETFGKEPSPIKDQINKLI